MNESIVLKILILGDSEVGKTSILFQYIDGTFQDGYLSTFGVEYKIKPMVINNINITLQIWDTAGQERFRSLSKSFIKDADGILFVYDITNKKSFENIKNWIKDTEENAQKKFQKIIIGNKCDLQKRKVNKEYLHKFCSNEKMIGFETSAKTGKNINEAFNSLAESIIGNSSINDLLKKHGRKDTVSLLKSKHQNVKDKKNCF